MLLDLWTVIVQQRPSHPVRGGVDIEYLLKQRAEHIDIDALTHRPEFDAGSAVGNPVVDGELSRRPNDARPPTQWDFFRLKSDI